MSTAYVGHGSIKILHKNLDKLVAHLKSLEGYPEEVDIEVLCGYFGIDLDFDNEGNIVDAFLIDSDWSESRESKFYREIAPFVEGGSYQTFYCDGDLFANIYRGGKVRRFP
jgi:hypothetical protein